MALRTCPMCQTTAEPKMYEGREVCPQCELQLPPADMKLPDPPDRPRPKAATARREKEWARTPRRTETATGSKKIGGFGLSVLLLIVAFVLLGLFYTAVIYVKTQKTTPTSKPVGGPGRWNGNPNDPWGGGPPPNFKD